MRDCEVLRELCGGGRPLLDDGVPTVADVIDDRLWGHAVQVIEGIPEQLRTALAQGWLKDAAAEHASIASFARAQLELMAVGAPPDLLAAVSAAAADEVQHARDCYALASAYLGRPVGPGPLNCPPPRRADLATVARNTFIEGCVGETIAALIAKRCADGCGDPAVRTVLERIARDEADHAALAWQTVRWTLERGGPDVIVALREAATTVEPTVTSDPSATSLDDLELAAHGRLGDGALATARDDAWRRIVEPMLDEVIEGARG